MVAIFKQAIICTYSDLQSTRQCPANGVMLGRSARSHISNGTHSYRLRGYSEDSMSGVADSLPDSGHMWTPHATWSSFQSHFHLSHYAGVTTDDPGTMSQGHPSAHSNVQSKSILSDLKGDRHLFHEGDRAAPKHKEVQHAEVTTVYHDDPGTKSQGHPSAHCNVKSNGILPDVKGDQHLFPGGDRPAPKHKEVQHCKLDQSDSGSQSTAPWIPTASYIPGVKRKALGGADQMTLQDQSDGSQSTAPWIPTASYIPGFKCQALGGADQMTRQDQSAESRLDDLMEIIATEGFVATPELNRTQSYYFS